MNKLHLNHSFIFLIEKTQEPSILLLLLLTKPQTCMLNYQEHSIPKNPFLRAGILNHDQHHHD